MEGCLTKKRFSSPMRCRRDHAQNSLIGGSSQPRQRWASIGHGVRAAGFGMNLQPVPVGVVAEDPVMVVDGKVAQRLAEIVQEAVALAGGY